MAERKSVNKYYPPDWDPSKGSVNNYVGQHPLRDRAKKLGQGILVIRFEMPYNIWCGGCGSHIGMGVRYNAEKSKTGEMYYTTPIYKFRMKCHLCDNYFEIVTDPKNHDYVIIEGARRKEQRWDPKENGQIETEDKAVQKKMVTDPMFKLEHGSDDIVKGKKALSNISSLETRRDEWKDDYILNKIARQKFRDEKKAITAETERDAALLGKSSLDIPLLKESGDDIKLAGLIRYRALESYDEKQRKKRKEIDAQPFFQSPNKIAKTDQATCSKLDIIKKHIRDSKLEKRTNAFDRMKMNTLTSGPSISKQTLGIRKKIASKDTNDASKDTNDASKDTNVASKDTYVASKDTYAASKDTYVASKDTDDTSKDTDDTLKDTNDASKDTDVASKDTNDASKDAEDEINTTKLVITPVTSGEDGLHNEADCSEETLMENTSSDIRLETCQMAKDDSDMLDNRTDSDKLKSNDHSGNDNTTNLHNDDIDVPPNKTDQKSHQNTSLGLVCSYSDTDSDS